MSCSVVDKSWQFPECMLDQFVNSSCFLFEKSIWLMGSPPFQFSRCCHSPVATGYSLLLIFFPETFSISGSISFIAHHPGNISVSTLCKELSWNMIKNRNQSHNILKGPPFFFTGIHFQSSLHMLSHDRLIHYIENTHYTKIHFSNSNLSPQSACSPKRENGSRTDSTHLPQHLSVFPGLAKTIFSHFLKLTAWCWSLSFGM